MEVTEYPDKSGIEPSLATVEVGLVYCSATNEIGRRRARGQTPLQHHTTESKPARRP